MFVVYPSRENVIFLEWQKLHRAAFTPEKNEFKKAVERIAESIYKDGNVVGHMIMMDDLIFMEECPHEEHDHGICLNCDMNIMNSLAGKAEDASDRAQDR